MLRLLVCLAALSIATPAWADPVVEGARRAAAAAFDKAAPHLGRATFGVETAAYRDALSLGHFASAHWAGPIAVEIVAAGQEDAGCGRYAAFVRLPPRDGRISLNICPEFSTPGAEALRRLTMLHEMVHVVAGPDECRAMAYAARIEQLAFGQFTPVERYWRLNGCAASDFFLP